MDTGSGTLNEYAVYVGPWINHSRGWFLGATLTLTRHDRDLLIAFLAVFVSFVAARFWKIICFILHRVYSVKTKQCAIYYQHQAILRNASSAEEGLRLLLSLVRSNPYRDVLLRPLSTFAVAVLCIVAFTLAGGYSSRVSTAIGDEVLIKSSNCGYRSPIFWSEQSAASSVYYSDRISSAATYAAQCYSNSSSTVKTQTSGCSQFVSSHINGNTNIGAACPFKDEKLCRTVSENLVIDSGILDSHAHFGLNAPLNERILWRNAFHCAPLVTEGRSAIYLSDHPSLNGSTKYYYGSYPSWPLDYTFLAPSLATQYDFSESNESAFTFTSFDLQLSTTLIQNQTATPDSVFLIDPIARDDADTFIFWLLGHGVTFSEPFDDIWYRVSPRGMPVKIYHTVAGTNNINQYFSAEPASPLASQSDAIAGAAPLFDTTYNELSADIARTDMAARFIYFIKSAITPNAPYIHDILIQLGPSALLSPKSQLNGIQYGLAANQWQLDLSNVWAIMMAGSQSALLDAAYGPRDPEILGDWVNFTLPEFQKLCQNQKFRTTSFASFSLFGLIVIFIVGGSLILASYILEPLSQFFYRKGHRQYEHLEWVTNSTLQLQRSAYEALEMGTWSNCTATIPTTARGELLGGLDISNPDHPLICDKCGI
ncbi:hypothetical protein E0Z10_g1603 [Xylaria hypoxylon]|uniref:Uncharacterized protein n=1 Tax=Xylaria hypoxylon TaxID=37992 RepID=A0A4Z0ZCB3_9PEZI|nr:hypothetical protein E0Z10_g1603 [Xylaria hypoxylon]